MSIDNKQPPSADEIQVALGPVGVEVVKVGEETTHSYVGGNVEDWVPKTRDIKKSIDHGNDHHVKKVICVWTEPSLQLVIFSVTDRITGRNVTVKGQAVQTLASNNALAIQFRSAKIGMQISDAQTGQTFRIANIGGGQILDYQQCVEKQYQLKRKERQISYAQEVRERRVSIEQDFRILAEFAELEEYRIILQQEMQTQIYFEQQELQHIDRLDLIASGK